MKTSDHPKEATQDELTVAATLRARRGWACFRTTKAQFFDLWLHEGNVLRGIAEVKRRNFVWGEHPTVHLSEKKILRCLDFAASLKVPFYLVVICLSGSFLAKIERSELVHFRHKIGGRFDRGRKQDIETLVELPLNLFEIL